MLGCFFSVAGCVPRRRRLDGIIFIAGCLKGTDTYISLKVYPPYGIVMNDWGRNTHSVYIGGFGVFLFFLGSSMILQGASDRKKSCSMIRHLRGVPELNKRKGWDVQAQEPDRSAFCGRRYSRCKQLPIGQLFDVVILVVNCLKGNF